MNKTLLERTHCILCNIGLSTEFWVETVNMACYLVNQSMSTMTDLKTPIEVWFGNPTDYSNLRIFGCPVYAHIDNGKA